MRRRTTFSMRAFSVDREENLTEQKSNLFVKAGNVTKFYRLPAVQGARGTAASMIHRFDAVGTESLVFD